MQLDKKQTHPRKTRNKRTNNFGIMNSAKETKFVGGTCGWTEPGPCRLQKLKVFLSRLFAYMLQIINKVCLFLYNVGGSYGQKIFEIPYLDEKEELYWKILQDNTSRKIE